MIVVVAPVAFQAKSLQVSVISFSQYSRAVKSIENSNHSFVFVVQLLVSLTKYSTLPVSLRVQVSV
ncbi:MAG: hypothetical protein LBQ59_03790 [Candidatus Peribacteria bacterium]|nr:hypothetical protein [Candidatus Peribacteria bacterium]